MVWLVFKERILLPLQLATHSKQRKAGIPFRQAHHIVGHIVNYCIKHNTDLERMTLQEYKQFSDAIEDDIHQFITLEACVAARRSFGGTAPERVKEQIERARARLALTHCGV